jgi:hypothetical protein
MKTKLLLLILFASICANAQIVNVPDANLKSALISNNPATVISRDENGFSVTIDVNDDDEIQVSEAQSIYSLEIINVPFTDITGIQAFSNLKDLVIFSGIIPEINVSGMINLRKIQCENNALLTSVNVSGCTSLEIFDTDLSKLTSLDVSGLTNLKEIHCNSNEISTVNLSGCIMLNHLQLFDNNLANINVSGLVGLRALELGSNMLTALNLTGLDLQDLSIDNNQITSIDVTAQENLKIFTFSNNPISTIDLSQCAFLEQLACSNTTLAILDLSNNPLLWELDADNTPIQSINLKTGGTNFQNGLVESSDLSSMPSLLFICADDEDLPFLQILTAQSGINPNINSYCTFTPGGDYNTITGTTIFDIGNDGCGTGDAINELMKVKITDGTNTGYTFTNNLSQYKFYTQAGNFTITPEFENNFFTATPAIVNVNFENNDNNTSTNNFCVTAVGSHPDVEVIIYPTSNAQPGFDATYTLVFRNKGNQTITGAFSFNYNENVIDFVSATPAPAFALDGQLQYEYAGLMPFEHRSINIVLNLNGPTETPPLNLGDELEFFSDISFSGDDETPQDNSFTFNQTVVGSYDPNDIICLEGDVVSPSQIGQYLHYAINFENTGTAPTSFIVVRVDVNPAQYDISTLRMLNSSHPVDVRVTGNIIEFIMPTAVLAAADHGNILFKLKSRGDLEDGNTVTKKAGIYFDYNFPIITNDANTTFQALSTGSWAKDESVKVYPNPSAGLVKVEALSAINSIELYDVQGRLLEMQKSREMNILFDISARATGIYFLKVKTENGVKVEKLIKE